MSSIERVQRALEEIRAGKMVILVDDEDRENEGDLVLAAERVTPEAINFMATHGRGLICLAMDDAMIDRLVGIQLGGDRGSGGHTPRREISIDTLRRYGVVR